MWQFIKKYTLHYWPYYITGLIALIITNYVTTLIPLKIKDAIDFLHTNSLNTGAIEGTIKAIIILALILVFSRTLSRLLIFTPGRLVEYKLRGDLYNKLMSLSKHYYQKENIGDLMSRLVNDIQSLRLTSALGFLHICNTVMIFSIVFYQMAIIDLKLTLFILTPIPVVLFLIRFFVKYLYLYVQESQQKLGAVTTFFVDTLSSIQLIKTYVVQDHILDKFDEKNQDYFDIQIKQAKVRSSMFPFIGIIGSIGHFVLFIMGGKLIIEGSLTLGEFVALSAYITLLAWPTASLAWIINIIQRGKVSWERLNNILNETPDVQDNENTNPKLSLDSSPHIQVKSLSFTYPNTQNSIFKNVSFDIKQGQTFGVFGPTGSGKSTLANILARIEPGFEGDILFNDHPISDYPIKSLRESLSYVGQQPFLFSLSIKENIQYGLGGHITSEESAKLACVYEDILKFPDAFDTIIGEKGVILSGGQKSRISLARALYKQHNLLILDDVLSAIDHDTEATLIKNMSNITPKPTTIIISHRISALTHCDTIIVLEKGEITDQGNHDTLSQKEGIYRHTWLYQKMMDQQP